MRRSTSCLAGIVVLLLSAGCPPTKPTTLDFGGAINGFVVAEVRGDFANPNADKLSAIRLPGVQVVAKNLTAGTTTPAVVSNTHGHFSIPLQPPGSYQICASAPGFAPVCDPATVTVTSSLVVLDHDVSIRPQPAVIVGRVLLDGNPAWPCYDENGFLGTRVVGKVTAQDGSGAAVGVPVESNNLGQYVLPAVMVPGPVRVLATCENGRGAAAAAVNPNGVSLADIAIKNSPPLVAGVTASVGTQPRRRASPGANLTLRAQAFDRESDPLTFTWYASNGTPLPGSGPTLNFTLPAQPSFQVAYVRVSDARGGVAYGQATLRGTSNPNVLLQGTVIDAATQLPVADAELRVSGKSVKSNAAGVFDVEVPESERYVISARKLGFGLVSRVLYAEATGIIVALPRAQQTTFPSREGGTVASRDQRVGARVVFGADAVVGAGGARYAGPVVAHSFVYDQTKGEPIPGDLTAEFKGRTVTMGSFAALDVQLADPAGNALQMAPGQTAKLSMDINPDGRGVAPPKLPLFLYDEARGIWVEHGQLTRVGDRYEGEITHLSAFNADTVFTDSACLRFTLDPTDAPERPFVVRMDYTSPAGGPRHNDFVVTENVNAIMRLPPNTPVTLEIHPASGPDLVLASKVVNSGPPTDAALFPDGFPPFDYSGCNGFDPTPAPNHPIVLKLGLPSHSLQWLVGFIGSTTPGDADDYKNQSATLPTAVAGQSRTTFAQWKAANGFDANPTVLTAGEARGVYYNKGDLRLGRNMHCRPSGGGRIACYVSNYGQPGGDAAIAIHGAKLAQLSNDQSALIATVAMEFDPAPAIPNTGVQFWAYKGDGTQFVNPALDSEGPKLMPNICLACHGGVYSATDRLVHGASFLPFDVQSFLFEDDVSFTPDFTRANQLPAMRSLNAMVRGSSPNTANTHLPITSLIDGWYAGCGGVNTAGCNAFDGSFTPTGWSAKPQLYQGVTKPYCRTCHVAQGEFADWTSSAQWTGSLGQFRSKVCVDRIMPHAEVPFRSFWFSTNPSAQALMEDGVNGLGLGAGQCPR